MPPCSVQSSPARDGCASSGNVQQPLHIAQAEAWSLQGAVVACWLPLPALFGYEMAPRNALRPHLRCWVGWKDPRTEPGNAGTWGRRDAQWLHPRCAGLEEGSALTGVVAAFGLRSWRERGAEHPKTWCSLSVLEGLCCHLG